MSLTASKNSRNSKGTKSSGLFSKIKHVFNPGSSNSSASRVKSRDEDGESVGAVATRTRSRMSMFGGNREAKEALEAERLLEERKSNCLAIKATKRDPPAVQRLLVDCEFCNPPPKYGRQIAIETPGFTTKTTAENLERIESLQKAHADLSNERDWNVGLDEWLHMREWWLTPTADAQPIHHLDSDLTPDRYYTVYDKMIYHTRPLKHPLNLSDVIKIVKAGWVGEGSWPQANDNDVWSTTDAEEIKEAKKKANEEEESATPTPAETTGGAANGTAPGLTAAEPKQTNGAAASPSPLASSATSPNASQVGLTGSGAASIDGTAGTAPEGKDAPRIHVQFSDRPHPRALAPVTSNTNSMPKLERVQSSMGGPLRPIRSSQSSVVSITDSE